jgi:predicted nucleotidyltransferase
MLGRFQTLFKSLNDHEVKYLVVGGLAAAIHGVPRASFDMDISIEATKQNAERLLDALRDAGFESANMTTAEDLLRYQITIFRDYVRLDVLTSTTGMNFDEAWKRREVMTYQGVPFYMVARDDFLRAKRTAGRNKDLEDVRALETGSDIRDFERKHEY